MVAIVKKSVKVVIVILYLFHALEGYGQTISPAPYYIEITENQTTHLVFESDITYIDVGDNNNFVADYTNSILRIKGKRNSLTTNLTVVTKDMNYYSFMVKYTIQPRLNYFIKSSESINNIAVKPVSQKESATNTEPTASTNNSTTTPIYPAKQSIASTHSRNSYPKPSVHTKIPVRKEDSNGHLDIKETKKYPKVRPSSSKEKGKKIEDLEKVTPKEHRELQAIRRMAQYALTDIPMYHHIKGKHGDIILKVTGIYHSLHNCYIKYEIENTGEVPYDVDYIEFGMREKRRPKRTALNDKIFTPVNILNGDHNRVLPYRKNRYVAILGKVAVPEGRVLYMELVENGRNIPLKIPYNKVQKKFLK